MKKSTVWYVIADGGRARFVARDDEGAFRTLSSFVSTELHKSAHELGKDRPARVKESASPARSAIEPRRDLHEAAKEDFIAAVAETLASEQKDGKFYAIVGGDYAQAINVNSKHKAAARAWIDWFNTESGFADAQGGLSPLIDAKAP